MSGLRSQTYVFGWGPICACRLHTSVSAYCPACSRNAWLRITIGPLIYVPLYSSYPLWHRKLKELTHNMTKIEIWCSHHNPIWIQTTVHCRLYIGVLDWELHIGPLIITKTSSWLWRCLANISGPAKIMGGSIFLDKIFYLCIFCFVVASQLMPFLLVAEACGRNCAFAG